MLRRTGLAASAAVLAVAGALGTAGAPAQTGKVAATPKITGKGVGKVRIGMLFSKARTLGLVGRSGPACELDPGSRAATLTSPLKGSVALTKGTPRRISRISIRSGAAARGVEVGDPLSAVKTAYPSAKVDKSQVATFRVWFVRVPKRGGGRIEFTVRKSGSHTVSQIDVPRVAFCE